MAWKLKNDRPIYTQLLEQIEQKIISGEYMPGSELPSVRDLAADAAVNPNTMQRAIAELETRGLVITNRTSGRVVTQDKDLLSRIRRDRAVELTRDYTAKMTLLKYSREDILEFIGKGADK